MNCAEGFDLGDAAGDLRADGVLGGGVEPGIDATRLVEREADLAGLAVELGDLHIQHVADLDDVAGFDAAAEGHLGDVEQSIDAAEIDEGAVVHDVADDAAADLPFGEFLEQLAFGFFLFAFQDVSAADDEVAAFAAELDDLGLDALADELGEVGVEVEIDLAGGHEGAHAFDVDFQAAFVGAGDRAFDDLADFEAVPGDVGGRGAFAQEHEHALARVEAVDDEFVFLADFGLGLELGHGDQALALAAEIDDGIIRCDGEDSAAAELAATLARSGGRGGLLGVEIVEGELC